MNVGILSEIQKIDYLFKKISTISDNSEMQAHWARYLCILSCGFIETSIKLVFTQYAKQKSDPKVANFVSNKLKRFANPNVERILGLAVSFSDEWHEKLSAYIIDERKDAIDSIVANRRKIAHGESVGITYAHIHSYHSRAVEVIKFIERQCR